ncbi:MAG: hypothetical protein HYT09_00885 [Candidatus Levybacteria bacterium]|nr:hypothetical protein [Candidatus Levybacteria bacterium]
MTKELQLSNSNPDNHQPLGISLDGARELVFMAGILVSSRDTEIGKDLYDLATGMWNGPSGSSYLVRRANVVPYRDNPENERVYYAMAVLLADRYREGEQMLSVPEFKQAPPDIVTDRYGTISSEEITDWLLNKSVAVPSK